MHIDGHVYHIYNHFNIILSVHRELLKSLIINKCTYYTNIYIYIYILSELTAKYIKTHSNTF